MSIKKTITSHLPHNSLSSKIWAGEEMLPEFREALLRIADSFIEYIGIPIDVTDITMTGSYANYNYTVFSDIDLHILIDTTSIDADTDLVREFFNAKRSFWNDRHDIELKGIEVELYPQDTEEEHSSSGVYSLQNNEWIVKPKRFKDNFDITDVEKKSIKTIKEINIAINNSIKNSSTRDIERVLSKIKKMRSAGLERAGELSNENIAYKIIRAEGYLQKLFDTKYKIQDMNLSKI